MQAVEESVRAINIWDGRRETLKEGSRAGRQEWGGSADTERSQGARQGVLQEGA